jgi:hypothetical protein
MPWRPRACGTTGRRLWRAWHAWFGVIHALTHPPCRSCGRCMRSSTGSMFGGVRHAGSRVVAAILCRQRRSGCCPSNMQQQWRRQRAACAGLPYGPIHVSLVVQRLMLVAGCRSSAHAGAAAASRLRQRVLQ